MHNVINNEINDYLDKIKKDCCVMKLEKVYFFCCFAVDYLDRTTMTSGYLAGCSSVFLPAPRKEKYWWIIKNTQTSTIAIVTFS